MNKCLYKTERKAADLLLGFLELILTVSFVRRVIVGDQDGAVIFAVIAVAVAVLRFVRGPFVGPAILEITEKELIWRSSFYIPTKTQRHRLESINALKVVGPTGDRRFRMVLVDGSVEEFRPYYGRLEPKVMYFLKNSLPKNILLIEEDPPGLLSQMRGDF